MTQQSATTVEQPGWSVETFEGSGRTPIPRWSRRC